METQDSLRITREDIKDSALVSFIASFPACVISSFVMAGQEPQNFLYNLAVSYFGLQVACILPGTLVGCIFNYERRKEKQ